MPKPELIWGVKIFFLKESLLRIKGERERERTWDIQIEKKVGTEFVYISLTWRLVRLGCLNETGLPRSLCAQKIS